MRSCDMSATSQSGCDTSPQALHYIIHWSILLALPLILLALNPNWIYTSKGTIDPWLYHGLFREYSYLQTYYNSTYYITRLPWIIPGMVVYSLFWASVANYVLHLAFYYLTLFSLYFALHLITDARTALLNSVLLGINCVLLRNTGWDYVSCPILAYLCLTFALLSKALTSPRQGTWLCAAGVSYALVLYCHLYPLVMAPILVLYYILANRRLNGGSLVGSLRSFLGCYAVGMAGCTFVLGTINLFLNDRLWFYAPSLRAMFVIAKDPVWKAADYSWLAQANWLVVPAATGIGALAYCLRRLLSRDQKACPLALLAQGLFLFLAMEVILGEIAGQIVLQYDYYACYLLPVASIALAVHFLRVPAEVSNRWYYLLVGAVVWTFAYVLKTDAIQLQFSGREAVCRVLLSVLAAALIVAAFVPYRVWSVAAMALLLTAVNATFYPCYFTKQSARPTYMRMTKSIDLIGQFCEDRAGRVRVWYDRQEPASWEYMSIASAYFYGYCLINERFPSLDAEFPVQITAGEPLVILSNKADAGVMADKALREKSLTYRTISVREIGTGAEAYSLMFGVVEPLLTAAGAHVSSR